MSAEGKPILAPGGLEAETLSIMEIFECVLAACGANMDDITMVHVFVTNNTKERFAEMNKGYMSYWRDKPLPARITTGCTSLALGANVEIDCVAKRAPYSLV